MQIGELFILGFRGRVIPNWLLEFERRFGLGGVILFDYNCETKTYDNNIESPEQVSELCREISALPSRPLIFLDQEGGKVRRLKESRGFAPLPSAWQLNKLPVQERLTLLRKSFSELRRLGFDFNFAPVVDLNINPNNPDIGAVERSFSDNPAEVEENVGLYHQAAAENKIGLSLKHYPGLGGATVNSHYELTDLSDSISEPQLQLFWRLGKFISGQSIVISHGIVKQWDPDLPTSMSEKTLTVLRGKLPEALFISDDLQMQGLRKTVSLAEACAQGLKAGLDMLCIGNNLLPEIEPVSEIVDRLLKSGLTSRLEPSLARVKLRKRNFKQLEN